MTGTAAMHSTLCYTVTMFRNITVAFAAKLYIVYCTSAAGLVTHDLPTLTLSCAAAGNNNNNQSPSPTP